MSNSKLTRQQKEAVGLLSAGTFLEFFDLYLYVHMTILLDDLFFPQTDPITKKLLAAFTFCSTYFLRPIGGFIMGRIGDLISRKFTILLTTFIMSVACLIMASTPTYAEIGIYATIMIIVARMLQGFSSLGEVIGAQIYMTEMLKIPIRCVMSGTVILTARMGTLLALTVASLVLSMELNWRYAFLAGAVVAGIGILARTRLRETPNFADYKKRMATKMIGNLTNGSYENKVNKKTALALFFTEFHTPICFCVAIMYLGNFMKETLNMSAAQVISQNLKVTIFDVTLCFAVIYFVKKVHPIKIAIITALAFLVIFPFMPYLLNHTSSLFTLFCLQSAIIALCASTCGTLDAIQYKYFPIGNRFTLIATVFGIASPMGYAFASFGLIPLAYYFGHYAVLIIFTPALIGYLWALYYFRKLEIKRGLYFDYPCEEPPNDDTAINEEDFDYEDLGDEYEPFTHRCEYSVQLLDTLNALSKEADRKINIKLIKKSIIFAKKWHGTQMRKTGDYPYYWHPLKVAEMVAERYLKTDAIVASILHDVVEDSDCTVELIEEKFNARIAEIVDRLTKKRFENGKHIKLSLEETLNRLQKVGDNEALFIKQMDRQHNLETIEGLAPHKQRKMAEETNHYFVRLVAIIGDKLNIYGKIHLENKMFKCCYDILRKKK